MSTEPTTEMMNEVIARFVGGKRIQHPSQKFFSEDHFGYVCHKGHWWNERNLQYHTSWDWLIPVIQKIKGMHLDILKQAYVMEYMKAAAHMNSGLLSLKIEEAHLGVYKFLTWYNQQKQINE